MGSHGGHAQSMIGYREQNRVAQITNYSRNKSHSRAKAGCLDLARLGKLSIKRGVKRQRGERDKLLVKARQ